MKNRKITLIIVHCSGVRPYQQSCAEDIDNWHLAQGWKGGIGYHYLVRRNGTVEPGRAEETVGAHCRGHNQHSIGVCYEGGLDLEGSPADSRTAAQKDALRCLLAQLKGKYPEALIVGHRDLDPKKACPCFDVREYADL